MAEASDHRYRSFLPQPVTDADYYDNGAPNPAKVELGAREFERMFPVTSGTEMAGQAGENPIADAAAAGKLTGPGGV